MPVNGTRITVTPSAYKLMRNDILYISVVTPDPQWSTLFNTVPVGTGGTLTEQSAALSGYPVDDNGEIELPFIGKLQVAGKTLSEIKVDLDMTLKNYVANASITVRMVNNYVSIIGEVNSPGRFPLYKDRINVFEALSMAGDLKDYSNRQNVQLIRQSPIGPTVKEFSLTDRSILSSEFYYIMPNDIIYAQPRKGRGFAMNSSISSMIMSSITTILVIYSFFRPAK
jgi:polysaccharide export outer membrane protein